MTGRAQRRLVNTFQAFLDHALERQFVIIGNAEAEDEFVQFKRNHRILYGEVGSREWGVADRRRPLDADSRTALAACGFTHGGVERNYICDNLAQSAPYLFDLFLKSHRAAYGSAPQHVRVVSNVPAVMVASGELASTRVPTPAVSAGHGYEEVRTAAIVASPGLRFRVERAMRSNFAEIASSVEELTAVRRAVEEAGSWEALPEWVRDWIRKAEEGPLWVVIGP